MSQEMDKTMNKTWDVIVIGGGPAGMMAAGRAAEVLQVKEGSRVLLLEKNDSLGKKLLITGGGRCNVTNNELDTRTLLSKFREAHKFLFSTFSQWSVQETLDFFHLNHMDTKVEAEKRVFPISNSAQSVWDVLVQFLKNQNVSVLSNSPVISIIKNNDTIEYIEIQHLNTKQKQILRAHSYILATGGKSRPETGSTGDGFNWLSILGHSVSEPSASLVPVATKDQWVKKLQGITLKEVKITLYQNEVKQQSNRGKILFTHFGVSGPTILNMSKDIGELLKYGEVIISLDILPMLDPGQLNTKIQEIFKQHSNKKIKNSLGDLLPTAVLPHIFEISKINEETFCHSITREERIKLIETIKNLRMTAKELLGVEKAIVTSGGVDLTEIDFKTMRSKLFSNLYIVGDLLNIDRPSGGYSLQLCWTTGFVAGTAAAHKS